MSSNEKIPSMQTQKHQMLENNDLKQIATWQIQEIFMTFFMEHTMAKLNRSSQYSELQIFEVFLE
jgi:hypothetical protein